MTDNGAPRRSIYVEFDVNPDSLVKAGNKSWSQIPGPGSSHDRLNQYKGLPPIIENPEAKNIKKVGEKR